MNTYVFKWIWDNQQSEEYVADPAGSAAGELELLQGVIHKADKLQAGQVTAVPKGGLLWLVVTGKMVKNLRRNGTSLSQPGQVFLACLGREADLNVPGRVQALLAMPRWRDWVAGQDIEVAEATLMRSLGVFPSIEPTDTPPWPVVTAPGIVRQRDAGSARSDRRASRSGGTVAQVVMAVACLALLSWNLNLQRQLDGQKENANREQENKKRDVMQILNLESDVRANERFILQRNLRVEALENQLSGKQILLNEANARIATLEAQRPKTHDETNAAGRPRGTAERRINVSGQSGTVPGPASTQPKEGTGSSSKAAAPGPRPKTQRNIPEAEGAAADTEGC